MYRWFVVETYFNVDNSDIFNILLWKLYFSPLLLCVLEMRIYRLVTLSQTRGHRERWLYFYVNIIIYENQAEINKCSIHNLFPEHLRLQLDMLVNIHLCYSSVCLAISRGNVVVSLYLVSPISVLMKHVLLSVSHLSLQLRRKSYMGISRIYAAKMYVVI